MIGYMPRQTKKDDHKTPRLAIQLPEDAARILREMAEESGRTYVEETRRALIAWQNNPARKKEAAARLEAWPKDEPQNRSRS